VAQQHIDSYDTRRMLSSRRKRRTDWWRLAPIAPFAALVQLGGILSASAAPLGTSGLLAQGKLAVGIDDKGALRARVCASEPCTADGGLEIRLPPEYLAALPRRKLETIRIGSGRRAILITVPGPLGQNYQVVLGVAPGGGQPKLVFSGVTGLIEGPEGVRQGNLITVSEADQNGVRHVVIGESREDIDLCGRPAVLAPKLLNPEDLALHPAKVQRLAPAERASAPRLVATPTAADAPVSAAGVLRAVGASSAVGAPGALTDGKLETTWAENRGGVGRGEFVTLSAPSELPITGFELVPKAIGAVGPKAAVPRELWLVTNTQVYLVTLPEEAVRVAGARFRVSLPAPVRTDCVALVTESAFNEKPDSEVGLAELSVTSDLGAADPVSLVGALAGGGERAEAAGALLRALGAPGYSEIVSRFDRLDEGGRRVALDVIDSAPCADRVPVYMLAFASSFAAQRLHAKDRFRACKKESAEALAAGFTASKGPLALSFAEELALVAPERAAHAVTLRLAKSSTSERRKLRVVLARASTSADARSKIIELLSDPALPPVATLDLLRALGSRISGFVPEASVALARLAADTSFRVRYLALAPSAALYETDAKARDTLLRAVADPGDARLRVRAIDVAPRDAASERALIAALIDPEVRVREAAARAVREGRFATAAPELTRLLEDDRWPIVRRMAAAGLGALPPEPKGDRALAEALEDEAPWVRASAAEALGARRVASAAEALRERLEDHEERFEVRRAAAAALGTLCDRDSVDVLTTLIRRVTDPLATAEERALGEVSMDALARIRPPDLDARFAPLEKTGARGAVAHARKAAQSSGVCR
jgi:HEAT repeat protein